MVYRHFTQTGNKDFSILTLSLAGIADREKAKRLLETAAGTGINLVWTGTNPVTVELVADVLESLDLRSSFSLVIGFDPRSAASEGESHEKQVQALRKQLEKAGSGSYDFLAFQLTDDGDCELLVRNGLLWAGETLKNEGKTGAYGFWAPPDANIIIPAIDSWDKWDFFSTDCNYLLMENEKAGLVKAIRYAADAGIGLLATNPFAGGSLETVSPDVHEIFRHAPVPRANDEWALRAVWELQETVSIAWEPPDAEQLMRKAIFAEAGRPNSLPQAELKVLKDAARKLAE